MVINDEITIWIQINPTPKLMLTVTITWLFTKVVTSGNGGWFEGKDNKLPFTPPKFEMPMSGLNENA